MSNISIELNHEAIQEILNSAEVVNLLTDKGTQIRNKAGSGYSMEIVDSKGAKFGDTRKKCIVSAKTKKARLDNSKNNTLLKAMGG